MVDYLKRGIRGTFFVALFTILAYASGYFTRVFLAKTLSPDEFGLFYSVFTFFMFICVFTDLGYTQALVKFIPEFLVQKKKEMIPKTINGVFIITMLLSLIGAALLFFLRDFLAINYFKVPSAVNIISLFIFILLLSSITSLFQNVFLAFQDMLKYGLFYFLGKFFFIVLCIALFVLGSGSSSFLPTIAYLISLILLLLIFAYPFFKKINFSGIYFKNIADKKLFLRISAFAIPSTFTTLAGTIIGYIDTLILTFMVPIAVVGIYNAVLPTVLVLSYVSGVISSVFFPMVSELWAKKDYKTLRHGISLIYKYSLIVVLPFAFSALLFAEPLLRLFFGESFLIGANSLRILAIGIIFLSIAQINFSVLNGVGKPKKITMIMIAAALFNVIINIILIPVFGIEGAALTTTLSYLVMMVWSYIMATKIIKFRIGNLFGVALSSIIFAGALYFLKQVFSITSYLQIVLALVAGGVAFIIMLFAFKAVTFKEVMFIIKNNFPRK